MLGCFDTFCNFANNCTTRNVNCVHVGQLKVHRSNALLDLKKVVISTCFNVMINIEFEVIVYFVN
jgi:hypothetical protein